MIHGRTIVHVTQIVNATARTVIKAPAANELQEQIIADFRVTIGAMKCAMSERLVRLGISMAQLHIMYTLERDGEMTMSRLADVLGVSLSNASGLVDRMEERGYIERTRVPEDRRIVLVRVTEAGTRMIQDQRRPERRAHARRPGATEPGRAAGHRPRHRGGSGSARGHDGPACTKSARNPHPQFTIALDDRPRIPGARPMGRPHA